MYRRATRSSDIGQMPDIEGLTESLLPGLSVGLYPACRGRFKVGPLTDHLLMVRVGVFRADAQEAHDVEEYGEIDLLPAGSLGIWQVEKSAATLRFRFAPAQLRSIAGRMGLNPDTVELLPQARVRDTQIEHIAAAIAHAMNGDASVERSYGGSLGTALLARVITRFGATKPAKSKSGLSKKQLQAIFDHIESHIDRQLSSTELAAVIGLSTPYFRILFQRTLGLPVHQYVIQRRVEKAKVLLQQGRAISQAAGDAGFADQSHLARSMRRVIGMLPLEVIRLNKPIG